jgi:hypothetical protein
MICNGQSAGIRKTPGITLDSISMLLPEHLYCHDHTAPHTPLEDHETLPPMFCINFQAGSSKWSMMIAA